MAYKVNYEEILKNILKVCKREGEAILISKLKSNNINIDIKSLNNYFEKETEYLTYQDFCRKSGYRFKNDVLINGSFKDAGDLEIEDYRILVKEYMLKNNKFPTQPEFKIKNNLPSSSSFYRMLKRENITYTDFNKMVGNNIIHPSDYSYEYWLEKYIKISNQIGRAVKYEEMSKYNLPSTRWMVDNCNNPQVTNFSEFIEFEAKMIPRYNMTKEMAIEKILELQGKLDRPLQKKDLTSIEDGGIGQSSILKHWNSFNDMKRELNLKIVGEDMRSKHKSLHDIKKDIARICVYVYETEKREIITQKDWSLLLDVASYPSCCRWLKEAGMNIREYISLIGFRYVEAGSGLNYDFEDGEHVKSQFEMIFSRVLKEKLNLEFNKDYFKEVRYATFISNYKGLLDCDYVIDYDNRKFYIEIAGMLRDYKENFLNNTPIASSKSKEKYRQKLMQKEQMLKDNNLEYHILFPSDLQEDFIMQIFNKEAI